MSTPQNRGDAAPRAAEAPFTIGRSEAGQWLAIASHGLKGGLFRSRADAIHFAEFESGRRSGAFDLSPHPLRLEF